jgi:hypothetical protein
MMKANGTSVNWLSLASYSVGILAFVLIFLVLTGKKIPLIGDQKGAFITIWMIGFSMSILAGFRDYPDGKFTMPGPLMGFLMVLGFAAVALLLIMLFGLKIPFIASYREALIILSFIMITKWVSVHIYKIFSLFS